MRQSVPCNTLHVAKQVLEDYNRACESATRASVDKGPRQQSTRVACGSILGP